MTATLACRGLDAGYGCVTVLRAVDLDLHPGRVTAVVGPNGAGKTTLVRTLAGLLPPLAGTVAVDGDVRRRRPEDLNRRGVVLVPDDRALFRELTTEQNLRLACRSATAFERAMDLFPPLRSRLDLNAGALSGGEQQMLALARALVQEPRALLIDEMSMGLAPLVVEQLAARVAEVAASGVAVLLVEQHIRTAMAVATDVVVIVHGDVTMQCPTSELEHDLGRLDGAYFGS